jgi:hypothetical protein
MSVQGQSRKSSLRGYVFRFAPESGHRARQSPYPFGAKNGREQLQQILEANSRNGRGLLRKQEPAYSAIQQLSVVEVLQMNNKEGG